MFDASCSRRARLASMPSRPSSARRPCTRYLSSIISELRERPWRFKPGTLPTKLVCINGQSTASGGRILLRHCVGIVPTLSVQTSSTRQRINALRASNIGTFIDIPPDCGRHTSVEATFRRFQIVTNFGSQSNALYRLILP